MEQSKLYFGDNLEILRRNVGDDSVDLIYLDPPFNSNRSYNLLFTGDDKRKESKAQMRVFEDTWHWNDGAAEAYDNLLYGASISRTTKDLLRALIGNQGKGSAGPLAGSDMAAYLVMMTSRLAELHRVLKPTGSLYLHCDPTASHYLKLVMDMIFGPKAFLGEIIWRRTAAHVTSRRWPRLHDVILCYARNPELAVFNAPKEQADKDWIEREYRHTDDRGRYMVDNLTGAGTSGGPSGQPWRGVDPAKIGAGRHWRYVPETLDRLDTEGRIYWPTKGQYPKLKQYLNETGGKSVGDLWMDISVLGRTDAERLGYPTQKPLALLERIIKASSNPDDVVLDPFCGCGTAIEAAEKLGRRWIGVDIASLAISVIDDRIKRSYSQAQYRIEGWPEDADQARELAHLNALKGRYDFQDWAVWRLGGLPSRPDTSGKSKKGPDGGYDGYIPFEDTDGYHDVLISVKSGHVSVKDMRELADVVYSRGAVIGALLTLLPPTGDILDRARNSERYYSPMMDARYPTLQVLTVDDLFNGKGIAMPPHHRNQLMKRAQSGALGRQGELFAG